MWGCNPVSICARGAAAFGTHRHATARKLEALRRRQLLLRGQLVLRRQLLLPLPLSLRDDHTGCHQTGRVH